MADRRDFVKQMAAVLGALSITNLIDGNMNNKLFAAERNLKNLTTDDAIKDNDFWYQIKNSYSTSPNIINLNNGGVAPSPIIVQDALDKYNRMCNEAPSYYMWRILDQAREPLRQNLANLAGVDAEEIAINRNSTEALNSIIFGLEFKAGDEVVLSKQGYPNIINAWKQREQRDKIKLVWVNMEMPLPSEEHAVNLFSEAMTSRTKLVHVTHVINWNGQIMPVRKIADIAHSKGIEVLVDGAHSFAHLDYKISDLGADYFGTSLHKWLSAPFGSGLLYVKKDKISKIWPLLSAPEPKSDNIRKFENLGTRSFPTEMAIGYALDFHNMITTQRKQKRLQYLKKYWTDNCKDLERFKLNTNTDENYSCGIANFRIEGKEPAEVDNFLFEKYKIHCVSINWENIVGVRITPNVYTVTSDLDKLIDGIHKLAKI